MSRGTEITRLGLRRIDDQARGLNRTDTRTTSMRQAEISIINRHMLPIQVVPGDDGSTGSAPGSAPMQVDGAFTYLAGYSAPPGSPAATPDATGRGGDTLMSANVRASGSSRMKATPTIDFPATGSLSAGATMTATPTIV
jgi:hypothetical protein